MDSDTQSIRETESTPSAESTGIQYENGELEVRRSDVPSLECIYALATLSESVSRTIIRDKFSRSDVQAIPVELESVIPIIFFGDGSTRGAPQTIDPKLRQNLGPGSYSESESDVTDRFAMDAGPSSCVDMKESSLASQSIIRILPLSRCYLSPGQRDATNVVNVNSMKKINVNRNCSKNGASLSAEHTNHRSGTIIDCSIETLTAHIEVPSEHLSGSIEDISGNPHDESDQFD